MNMTRVELCAAFSGGVRRPPEQPVHCDHEHRHGGDAERHPGKSPAWVIFRDVCAQP